MNEPTKAIQYLIDTAPLYAKAKADRIYLESFVKSRKAQLMSQAGSDANRIQHMFSGITCRQPSPAEEAACLNLLTQMRERYQASPDDAKQLLSVGETPYREDFQKDELAAWTILTTTFLASDAVIMLY